MNDLCFRIHAGPVGALLVTNGWNDPPQRAPRFLHDLWPARLDQLDRALSPERGAEILRLLDEGRGVHDEGIDRLIVGLGPDRPLSPELLAAYVRELAPGGTSTLHPHRENRIPQMDAMMVTGVISLRDRMQEAFSEWIREDFGGEVYRLYKAKKSSAERLEEALHDSRQSADTLTLSAMIEKIHDQLRHSYVVVSEVPNERQDGARHALSFRIVETRESSKGKTKERRIDGRLGYVPFYKSSRPVRDKLPVLAASPFVMLRLLAAYELRNHWGDPGLDSLLERRVELEHNEFVRTVAVESLIVANLKRVQGGPDARAERALARLETLAASSANLPDPLLALDAARLARRHVDTRGE
jgi:hypothetical protein